MAISSYNDPADSFQLKRIKALYANAPSSMMAIAAGILLVVLVLSPTTSPSLLKPWAVFMLSALVLRLSLWFMQSSGNEDAQNLRHWEWAYAASMFLTGLGWGALSGPLYPESPNLQVLVLVLTMVTAFSGTVYSAVSRLSFFMFALPSVVPGMLRYVMTIEENYQLPGFVATAVGIFVLINVHLALSRFAIRQLRHEVEIEGLLTQQEAIFQTVTAGIAIVRDGKTIKCNTRLGEILGRSLKDIQSRPMTEMLISTTDVDAIMAATVVALKDGTPCYALHQMRRADGSEFWAELSGRRMTKGLGGDMIWLINDIGQRDRRSNDSTVQSEQKRDQPFTH